MSNQKAIRRLVDERAGVDPGRREAFLIALVARLARSVSTGHARAGDRVDFTVKRTEDVE